MQCSIAAETGPVSQATALPYKATSARGTAFLRKSQTPRLSCQSALGDQDWTNKSPRSVEELVWLRRPYQGEHIERKMVIKTNWLLLVAEFDLLRNGDNFFHRWKHDYAASHLPALYFKHSNTGGEYFVPLFSCWSGLIFAPPLIHRTWLSALRYSTISSLTNTPGFSRGI